MCYWANTNVFLPNFHTKIQGTSELIPVLAVCMTDMHTLLNTAGALFPIDHYIRAP